MPVYDDPANRLEILRMGYQNQLEYLRMMSDLDLKLFTGYITLQIVLGGWLAKSPVEGLSIKVGLMVIDLAMAFIGIVAFRVNQERRAEAARVLASKQRYGRIRNFPGNSQQTPSRSPQQARTGGPLVTPHSVDETLRFSF